MINVGIIGTGSYLPKKVEKVEDFLKKGITQEEIDNLGVFEHRVMAEDETVTDMEVEASKIAIEAAQLRPNDIDLIICGSAMPRQIGVPNSNALQHKLGAKNAAAFDIVMGCASAIPEIVVAAQFIASKSYKHILLVGSCHFTRVADYTDPASFVVLGDGAGALVMAPAAEDDGGILSFDIQTKGEYFDYCGSKIKKPKKYDKKEEYYDNCQEKLYFYIDDSSPHIIKYLISSVPATVKKSLNKAELSLHDIDFFICHQNITPLSGRWIKLLSLPIEKTHMTYAKYGNMSAANIFVNLDEALRLNKINKGDLVVFAGQGAGFSVGSIVMRW